MNKIEISDMKGALLLATPKLDHDPLFNNSLVYISKHSVISGSEGMILNKPTKLEFHQLFKVIKIDNPIKVGKSALTNNMVLIGGPELVKNTFIFDESLKVRVLTENALKNLIEQEGLGDFEVSAGISSWASGQLEKEIFEGLWLPITFDCKMIFGIPYESRYDNIVQNLGLTSYFAKQSLYD